MDNLWAYEYIMYLLGTVEMIYFFYKLMPTKINKVKDEIIYSIILILAYSIIPSINIMVIFRMEYGISTFMLIIINYLALFLYPIIFREGNLSEKIFLGSFYISMTTLLAVATGIICSFIFNITYREIAITHGYPRVIYLISMRLIHFIFILITLRYKEFTKYIDNKSLYTRSIILIFNQIILLIFIRYTIEHSIETIEGLAMATLFLFLIEIISLYGMNIFSKEMRCKHIIIEELNYKNYEEHILNIYQEMSAWRHDIRNHNSVVLGLLSLGETKKAIEYINDVESISNVFDVCIYTNNIVIDSLLSNKINIAKEKNIEMNIKIDMSSEIKIPNVDICTIIGNLMDNSIEACDKFKDKKFIDIIIISSDQLVIRVKNSSNGCLKKERNRFLSTKEEKGHGFGLIQIDSVVKKFDGYINREYSENIFNTYIRI